jgi:CheY-like chemotaxis protein
MITKIKVLLIDDDPVFHFINSKVLEHLGLTSISTALNGQEALNLISSCKERQPGPGAIFVDLDMPILNGFGFIEAYKKLDYQNKNKIGLAIVTSSYNPDDIKRAKDLGVTHYITKPLTTDSVKPVLESIISE